MIGIDFDNTIVCYDDLFVRVAAEERLVPPDAATSKTAIRDHLRTAGQEDRWTNLQGVIYGRRIMDARPFPGVLGFFAACYAARIPVVIVSHRTRFPYLGDRHDLHAAARDWLARHGFHDPSGLGLPVERVFFEETKEEKLARILDVGCTHFIDDLPELLAHPLFPAKVRRILFDPHGQHGSPSGIDVAPSWAELRTRLVGVAERVSGGGNNRVFRLETATGPLLLKEYFRHAGDPRDRLAVEQNFSRFAWSHGVRALPQPLACDRDAGVGIYECIHGRKLLAGEVTADHVDQAAAFLAAVNRHRDETDAARLPSASEACFSLREHVSCVDRRLERLKGIEPESLLHLRAGDIVANQLTPTWKQVRAAIHSSGVPLDAPLAVEDRLISPSDFGFHNCIDTSRGLKFLDFEYAGWDDPAKTVCDFFCQPAVPVPDEHLERFLTAVAEMVGGRKSLSERVALLLPVYKLKWCCIMLNEFMPISGDRRVFARADGNAEDRRLNQLRKVEAALARIVA